MPAHCIFVKLVELFFCPSCGVGFVALLWWVISLSAEFAAKKGTRFRVPFWGGLWVVGLGSVAANCQRNYDNRLIFFRFCELLTQLTEQLR